jgi:hypothetical protein
MTSALIPHGRILFFEKKMSETNVRNGFVPAPNNKSLPEKAQPGHERSWAPRRNSAPVVRIRTFEPVVCFPQHYNTLLL